RVMQDHDYQELLEALQQDETSNVLMFSTEGDTDTDNYKKILWR
ncbi:diaminopropionate ammonia-lyase, partial [Enterococcus faecalis]